MAVRRVELYDRSGKSDGVSQARFSRMKKELLVPDLLVLCLKKSLGKRRRSPINKPLVHPVMTICRITTPSRGGKTTVGGRRDSGRGITEHDF